MNRKKVIHEKNDWYRVISVANGQWQAQKRIDKEGTKTKDPWLNIGLPTTLILATVLMNDACPT